MKTVLLVTVMLAACAPQTRTFPKTARVPAPIGAMPTLIAPEQFLANTALRSSDTATKGAIYAALQEAMAIASKRSVWWTAPQQEGWITPSDTDRQGCRSFSLFISRPHDRYVGRACLVGPDWQVIELRPVSS